MKKIIKTSLAATIKAKDIKSLRNILRFIIIISKKKEKKEILECLKYYQSVQIVHRKIANFN